jgi:sorbitol-specific phosphotransferase system component IIA
MGEPPRGPARRRRPTLSDALKAAKRAGKQVKSAVVEDGKVTLVFSGDETPVEAGTNEWDKALGRGKH